MAEKKQTTTKPAENKALAKPRRSAIERLQEELRAAQEAETRRAQKKVANAKAKLENLLVQKAKLEDRIADAEAELTEAKGQLPLVTDGVGQPEDAIVSDGTDPDEVEPDEDPDEVEPDEDPEA